MPASDSVDTSEPIQNGRPMVTFDWGIGDPV